MTPRFLVVGEVNADVIVRGLPSLPVMGRELLCESVERAMGGSSAIVACRLAMLGCDVSFLGVVGDDAEGRLMRSSLERWGVRTELLEADPSVATGATYVLSFPHDRAMFTHLGSIGALTPARVRRDALGGFGHVHVSSAYVQTGLTEGLPELLAELRGMGLTLSLDPQWDPEETWRGFREMARSVDYLLPNEEEALSATGAPSVEEAARELAAWTPGLAVVKRGARGACVWCDGGLIEARPPRVSVIDTTGAGDTFDAALLRARLVGGLAIAEALRYACAAGALACTQLGGAETALPHSEVLTQMEASR